MGQINQEYTLKIILVLMNKDYSSDKIDYKVKVTLVKFEEKENTSFIALHNKSMRGIFI